ncbi:hypothetical protein INR49_016390 [Caranx melampygus]|nr:hypothetical protein INR49_016390 [Caranx melampygus]
MGRQSVTSAATARWFTWTGTEPTPAPRGEVWMWLQALLGGKEYDNLPEAFPITLEWGGRVVRETVYWFQYETDTALNSNVYDVAMNCEILVQKVVNTILHHTAKKNPDEYNPVSIDGAHVQRLTDTAETQQVADPQPPTKIILTGQKQRRSTKRS